MARTVTNTRVVDNDTGNTIARIRVIGNGNVELTTPNGEVIGTCKDTAPAILFHLQLSGY
jgi:hypothetical protein